MEITTDHTQQILQEENYRELIHPYVDALQTMMYCMEAWNKEFLQRYQTDPVHHIKSRIKTKKSIADKLKNMEQIPTLENARKYLTDIVGIRVTCHFLRDIQRFVDMIKAQTDMILLKERDYIGQPKSNGYRSHHLVFAVPVYQENGVEYYPVELQFRTLSMDYWASMEHRICYKSETMEPWVQALVMEEFLEYARQLEDIEAKIERYCWQISY